MTGPGYPGVAYRPRIVHQLKRDPNATWGNNFLGSNCGCAVDAMTADRATKGAIRKTGARMRELIGDRTGGTNLEQSDKVLASLGVSLEVRTPGRFVDLEAALYAGRGANVAGWYAPVQGTKYQGSETFTGSHRIFLNEGRGWSKGSDGRMHAAEILVLDPLADGRRAGIDEGPTWWPTELVESFTWRLDVSDPAEPYRALGKGLAYYGLTIDTEPHVTLRYGGVRTSPFPDRTRVANAPKGRRVNIRRAPNRDQAPVDSAANGDVFIAWQHARGEQLGGSRLWYGNQNGNRWIHSANLIGEGGTS